MPRGNDLSDVAVIARNLHPGIWDGDVEYSREIAEQRTAARKAAASAMSDRPDWAKQIIREYRAANKRPPQKRSSRRPQRHAVQ